METSKTFNPLDFTNCNPDLGYKMRDFNLGLAKIIGLQDAVVCNVILNAYRHKLSTNGEKDYVELSISEIENETGLFEKAVSNIIAKLKCLGIISTWKHPDHPTYHYTVNEREIDRLIEDGKDLRKLSYEYCKKRIRHRRDVWNGRNGG